MKVPSFSRLRILVALAALSFTGVSAQAPPNPSPSANPVLIEALWGNKWYTAHVIEKSVDPANPKAGIQNKVHYDGSWNYFDEWLGSDHLRTLDGSPLPAPTPTADDLAFAAQVRLTGSQFFVGTWSLGGIPVMNVTKREKLGDGKTVRETSQMQGGGDRGYLRINADGTFVWAGRPGGKTSGRWHENHDPKLNGDLILDKAAGSIGDAYVSRKRGAMISLMQGQGGPSSFGEWVRDDSALVLVARVGLEFYHGEWTLYRHRTSNLLKSDYGKLEIRADGTFTHTDAGKKTTGSWVKTEPGDGLVLRDPWGEGDFRLEQDAATAGFKSQGVQQTHIGVYGKRPIPARPAPGANRKK